MTLIEVQCNDQVLNVVNEPVIASGGINEDVVAFDFVGNLWDGYEIAAVFYRDDNVSYKVLLDLNNRAVIPWEVLQDAGVLYFGVFGINSDGDIRTSDIIKYDIKLGATTSGIEPTEHTPDIYAQFVSLAQEIKDVAINANNVAVSANSKSDTAITTANNAASLAASASLKSDKAVSVANNAVSVASSANSKSDSAVETANNAKNIMEQAATFIEIPATSDLEVGKKYRIKTDAAPCSAIVQVRVSDAVYPITQTQTDKYRNYFDFELLKIEKESATQTGGGMGTVFDVVYELNGTRKEESAVFTGGDYTEATVGVLNADKIYVYNSYAKVVIEAEVTVDDLPTEGSTKPVSSGGVYSWVTLNTDSIAALEKEKVRWCGEWYTKLIGTYEKNSYAKSDVVSRNNVMYICNKAHTTAEAMSSPDDIDEYAATYPDKEPYWIKIANIITDEQISTWNSKQDRLEFDAIPIEGSFNPVYSDGLYLTLLDKQDVLTFDDTPTIGSNNVVTSNGVATSIATLNGSTTQATNQLESKKFDKITETTAEYESAVLGSELATDDGWTTDGWTGSFADGFTHTSGNTTPLVFTMPVATGTKMYQVSFKSSATLSDKNLFLTIGGSEQFSMYGQPFPIEVGIQSVSDGNLEFIPSSDYTGTISEISIKEITDVSQPIQKVVDADGETSYEIRSSNSDDCNVFNGLNSGQYNTSGFGNVGIGARSLSKNTSGFWNIGIGFETLMDNTVGSRNVGIGYGALRVNKTGHRNIALGSFSLISNKTGYQNISIGADCMDKNESGYSNVSIGFQAMYYGTAAFQNVALGGAALHNITTGSNNVSVGYATMPALTTGTYNIGIGYGALGNTQTGVANVGIGQGALYKNLNGNDNVGIGRNAGLGAGNFSFTRNVCVGFSTGTAFNRGVVENTLIGAYAGNTITTGSYNICIGSKAQVKSPTSSYQLSIGNLIYGDMTDGSKYAEIDGGLQINSLPTSDPAIAGRLWNDNGTVKVSAG